MCRSREIQSLLHPCRLACRATSRKGRMLLLVVSAVLSASSGSSKAESGPSWREDVRPILEARCVRCHRPRGSAPQVDLSFHGSGEGLGAARWARAIAESVVRRRMPPWLPDPRFDDLLLSPRLTDREVEVLTAWARAGARMPADEEERSPRAGRPRDLFTLAPPDLVAEAVPGSGCRPIDGAHGERHEIGLELERSRWVTGLEFLSPRPRSLRRISAYVDSPAGELQDLALVSQRTGEVRERRIPTGPRFLGQWQPGDRPMLFPETSGFLLPAGSRLLVEILLAGDDTEPCTASRLRLGLLLDRPRQEIDLWLEARTVVGERAVGRRKGGRRAADLLGELTFGEDVQLVALYPRIDGELSSYELELEYRDGRRRTLLLVPDYRAEWSSSYPLAEPLPLPAGTTVQLRGRRAERAASSGSPPRLGVVLQYVLADHLIGEAPDLPSGLLAELGYGDPPGGSGAPAAVDRRVDAAPSPPPQLFRADNGYHRIEGSIPLPGAFRLRVADPEGRLLDPRNFAGELVFEGYDELSRTFVETQIRLRPFEQSLWARVPRRLPVAFHLVLWLSGEQRRFDFDFEEPRAGPVVRREVPRPVVLPDPLKIGDGGSGARRELGERLGQSRDELNAALASESWVAVSGTARELWRLGVAASGATAGLGPDERGRLRLVSGELARAALALHRAAESEKRYELGPGFERVEAAVAQAIEVLAGS